MTKRLFYPLFRDAWQEAFTLEYIEHAFEKASIWPMNSETVIGPLRRPTTNLLLNSDIEVKTPLTCRTTRRIHRAYQREPTKKKLELIFRSHEKLSAQVSVDQHIIRNLRYALKTEKTKRKKNKRLNLVGEESNGPQFFSPARINAAINYQAEKEGQEEAEKQARIENKARKAKEKEEKEAQKKKNIEERLRKRTEAQVEKNRKAIERTEKAAKRKVDADAKKALKEACKVDVMLANTRKRAFIGLNKPRKALGAKRTLVESTGTEGSIPVAKRAVTTNSRGRPVLTPARFL